MRIWTRTGAILVGLSLCVSPPRSAMGQDAEPTEEVETLSQMSLEELLQMEVTVAAHRPTTLRNSPGAITVVTREEIMNAGLRDMIDVLLLVPGFFPNWEIAGTAAVGFRGISTSDGKALFMIDGLPINENLFLSTPLGSRIPVTMIERVEVIRGPGSVRYGGGAELTVVNIITLSQETPGTSVFASGQYGHGKKHWLRQTGTAGLSYQHETGFWASGYGYFGRARPGLGTYTDFQGDSIRLEDGSEWRPMTFQLATGFKGLTVRYLFDGYRTPYQDGIDAVIGTVQEEHWTTHILDARYDWEVSDRVTVIPRLNFTRQFPYRVKVDPPDDLESLPEDDPWFADRAVSHYDRRIDRTTASVNVNIKAHDAVSLNFGTQAYVDYGRILGRIPELNGETFEAPVPPYGGDDRVHYEALAVFGEMISENRYVNVAAGARFEWHSKYGLIPWGPRVVPRLVLSRTVGDFHAKAMLSKAFRAPVTENLRNPDIKPEHSRVFELEVGYKFSDHAMVTVNGFNQRVDNAIVYGTTTYENFAHTGTSGFELDGRFPFDRGYINSTYSFQSARGQNRATYFGSDGFEDRMLLGYPQHKATLNTFVKLYKGFGTNSSLVAYSERVTQSGYTYDEATDTYPLEFDRVKPGLLWNMMLHYRDVAGLDGLELMAGVFNILEHARHNRFLYIQPYQSYHAPMPGQPREYLIRVSYGHAF